MGAAMSIVVNERTNEWVTPKPFPLTGQDIKQLLVTAAFLVFATATIAGALQAWNKMPPVKLVPKHASVPCEPVGRLVIPTQSTPTPP
jgi:hypothetical protein